MTAFLPLPARKAIEFVEAAGVQNAAHVIRDHAAAGLVKSYALAFEVAEVAGRVTTVRDATVPLSVWKRIVAESADPDVWTGGTVRLPASQLIGGLLAVSVTGIGFKHADLQRMVDRLMGGADAQARKRRKAAAEVPGAADTRDSVSTPAASIPAPELTKPRQRPPADHSLLQSGALLLTIADAGRALGLGRTKINQLIGREQLKRVYVDGAPRITTASVKALAAVAV